MKNIITTISRMDIQYKILCWIMVGQCITCFVFAIYRYYEGRLDKVIILTVSLVATILMLKLMLAKRYEVARWLYIISVALLLFVIAAYYPANHGYWIYPGILSVAFALRGIWEALIVLSIVIISTAVLLSQGDMSHVLVVFSGSLITQVILVTVVVSITQRSETDTKQALAEAINRSELDGLTQIFNRRVFEETLREAFYSNTYSVLILIDIDHFKAINDEYGHAAGDRVLKKISVLIKSALRNDEFLARYGGEEFAVIIENTNFESAQFVAERIRAGIERREIELIDSTLINCTASFGLASNQIQSIDKWFEQADANLYKAKSSGRNQVKASE